MRQTARTLAGALLATMLCAVLAVADAQAQIVWKRCGNSNDVACGHLTVPLDPSGAIPGTITLAMRRHRSPLGESKDAVIALAGGPGQSAIPFLSQFGEVLGPIAATRDVIAFDQRGTGLSHPLSCAAFEHLTGGGGSLGAIAICAGQIGPTRELYTTADTVADIEAIRQAGGYEKLVLYGTSYGTKVAERYAQEHPRNVEALVLDSVVTPNGPEPFDETSFAAVGRVLHQLCSGEACAQATPEPVRDLARLVRRIERAGPVSGRVIDGDGHATLARISANDLIEILLAGDLNPILRSEFPAAVRSAARGDTAALARLKKRAQSEPEQGEAELSEGFDAPLYYSTICDETAFPWKRSANPKTRLRESIAALRAQPAKVFAPFTAVNALALSDVPTCAGWPFTPGAVGGPELDEAPLPNVPTLILSGADDLRTPTANAKMVAAQIPDAHLLVVPNTGHSVLGSDLTSCSHNALQAQFAAKPIKPCKAAQPPPLLLPTPLAPNSLGAVPAAPGSHGRVGRTLSATVLTLADFARQMVLALVEHSGAASLLTTPTVRIGGLRAGWGASVSGALTLDGYSYVPGVTLSGKLSSTSTAIRVGGSAAAHGTIRINARGMLTGALGGQRVRFSTSGSTALGDSGLVFGARARSSVLFSGAKRLAALRARGKAALLRDVLGARAH